MHYQLSIREVRKIKWLPDEADGMVREGHSAFPDLQIPHHYGLKEVLLIHCMATW